jgi:hypothetical protein
LGISLQPQKARGTILLPDVQFFFCLFAHVPDFQYLFVTGFVRSVLLFAQTVSVCIRLRGAVAVLRITAGLRLRFHLFLLTLLERCLCGAAFCVACMVSSLRAV